MPTSDRIANALNRVTDRASLLQNLLAETLDWPLDEQVEKVEDVGYGWSQDDLRAQELDKHLIDGQVWQFQPFRSDQPWGIFLLQFKRPELFSAKGGMTGATGVLRKVLPPALGQVSVSIRLPSS